MRAVEVEPEVEERAALLLCRRRRGHPGRPIDGQRQPQPVGHRVPNGAVDRVTPLCGPLVQAVAGQGASHRRRAPPLHLRLGDLSAGREHHVHRPRTCGGRRRRGEEAALGITGARTVRQRVQVLQCRVQGGGERGQLGRAGLGLGQAGGDPRPQVGLHVPTGTGLPHREQLADLLQREPQVLGRADERQPLDRVLAVHPGPARSPVSGQETGALVETQSGRRHARALSEPGDGSGLQRKPSAG